MRKIGSFNLLDTTDKSGDFAKKWMLSPSGTPFSAKHSIKRGYSDHLPVVLDIIP
jgi:hypothetical protein